MQQFEVTVQLKPEVLDPEGRAIRETLGRVGVTGVEDVTVAKRYVLKLSGQDGQSLAEKIAAEYLANPVSETYVVRKLDQ